MHNPQAQHTISVQYHQGDRDRDQHLEAAERGSSYGGPQGELQGEAQAQREAGREGQTGEEEKISNRSSSLYRFCAGKLSPIQTYWDLIISNN